MAGVFLRTPRRGRLRSYLYGNQLTGTIPDWIVVSLQNLRELCVPVSQLCACHMPAWRGVLRHPHVRAARVGVQCMLMMAWRVCSCARCDGPMLVQVPPVQLLVWERAEFHCSLLREQDVLRCCGASRMPNAATAITAAAVAEPASSATADECSIHLWRHG